MTCYDAIGISGVILTLLAYIMVQIGLLNPSSESEDRFWYSLLNFGGSFFILVSLMREWNTAAVMMEVAWLIASTYGVVKYYIDNR
jgi:hypothetical protein